MGRPLTLDEQRRSHFPDPAVDADYTRLAAVHEWLRANRNTDRLEQAVDGPGYVHLHRQSRRHPWAEAGRYPSHLDFAMSRGIGAPR